MFEAVTATGYIPRPGIARIVSGLNDSVVPESLNVPFKVPVTLAELPDAAVTHPAGRCQLAS